VTRTYPPSRSDAAMNNRAARERMHDCAVCDAAVCEFAGRTPGAEQARLGEAVDVAQAGLQVVQLRGRRQVGLVQHQPVRVRDLLQRLVDHAQRLLRK